jgi:hypothetical protein
MTESDGYTGYNSMVRPIRPTENPCMIQYKEKTCTESSVSNLAILLNSDTKFRLRGHVLSVHICRRSTNQVRRHYCKQTPTDLG